MNTEQGSGNPAMQMGWPGVLRVLTVDERFASEREWDQRFKERQP